MMYKLTSTSKPNIQVAIRDFLLSSRAIFSDFSIGSEQFICNIFLMSTKSIPLDEQTIRAIALRQARVHVRTTSLV